MFALNTRHLWDGNVCFLFSSLTVLKKPLMTMRNGDNKGLIISYYSSLQKCCSLASTYVTSIHNILYILEVFILIINLPYLYPLGMWTCFFRVLMSLIPTGNKEWFWTCHFICVLFLSYLLSSCLGSLNDCHYPQRKFSWVVRKWYIATTLWA